MVKANQLGFSDTQGGVYLHSSIQTLEKVYKYYYYILQGGIYNEKKGRMTRKSDGNIETINENIHLIAENTMKTSKTLDKIDGNIDTIKKSSTSKLPLFITVIATLATISGVLIPIIIESQKSEDKTVDIVNESVQQSDYEFYLYSEYSTFELAVDIDMTVTLNFETDAVNITAYLESGRQDTISLERKSSTEWHKKVVFEETGIHKVIARAMTPNGEVIEDTIEVEVIPTSIDTDIINKLLEFIN